MAETNAATAIMRRGFGSPSAAGSGTVRLAARSVIGKAGSAWAAQSSLPAPGASSRAGAGPEMSLEQRDVHQVGAPDHVEPVAGDGSRADGKIDGDFAQHGEQDAGGHADPRRL